MKISGIFSAIDQFGNIISSGDNLIVDDGKQIFLNWLTHSGFQNSENGQFYQGQSLSSQRFLTSDQFNVYADGGQLGDIKTFWSNSNVVTVQPQSGEKNYNIYLNFINPIKLSGLFMCFNNLNVNLGRDSFFCSQYILSVYTSQYQRSIANASPSLWVLRKNYSPDLIGQYNVQNMIRFQSASSVDGYIDNVKSVKIVFRNLISYDTSYYQSSLQPLSLKGIGILTKEPYCNVPCVIGLGYTNRNSVNKNDTSLYDLNPYKFYVTSQKCTATINNESSNSSNSNSSISFSFSGLQKIYSYSQLKDVTKIDIIYRARIGYQNCNGQTFNEIGLFYSDKQVDAIKGAEQCNKMFSHGLFNNSWTKTDNKIIDIQYILSIGI